jgi:hypothetical protein
VGHRVGDEVKQLFIVAAAALLLGGETWPHPQPAAPLVGFSFSPHASLYAGRDATQDLALLLDATQPDLVRLPIYWEDVEPTPDQLDFDSIDPLLTVVANHNLTALHQTRVVLTIGARNFLFPELHEPDWAGPRQQPYLDQAQAGSAYRMYFDTSITRYRGSPLLYAWQVENEPLDFVGNDFTGDDQISASQLEWEVGEVHRLDPAHKAVVTTYNGMNVFVDMLRLSAPAPIGASGHPADALDAGDALGLDLYVDGPNISFRHFVTIDLREQWKQETVSFWGDQASRQGKDLWVAEMQAQPWSDSNTFKQKDLVASAVDYRQDDLQVVLMWGVETWLNDPSWLAAGAKALQILRS